MELVPIRAAARERDVSPITLRRWEKVGQIAAAERTHGSQRRYQPAKLRALASRQGPPSWRGTLTDARVSRYGQQEHLGRPVAWLEFWGAANGWTDETIPDLGSGRNDRTKGLRRLITRSGAGDVGRLVITHQDRLLRFGSDLVFSVGEPFGTAGVIVHASAAASVDDERAQDGREIIPGISARRYGSRPENTSRVEALPAAAEAVAGS